MRGQEKEWINKKKNLVVGVRGKEKMRGKTKLFCQKIGGKEGVKRLK